MPKPADLKDLAGSWGGSFSDAKLNDEMSIREAVLELSVDGDGAWSGSLDATFVVHMKDGDVLVGVRGAWPPGKVDGDAIKFEATTLTRTILSTGAENKMDGNPMELRREPDGRLEAKFVGDGGFTLTMMRKK